MWGCELWNQSHECRWADRHLKAARIAVLANPAEVTLTETQLREVEAAAGAMALRIQIHNADTGKEIDAAFETIDRERPDAVFIATTPFLNGRRIQLAQLAPAGLLWANAAPIYSITSSARRWIEGGTSMPSVLAVVRLIASSNTVGCSTGNSEGFAPLRIRPA
jgi:hypothetical protein